MSDRGLSAWKQHAYWQAGKHNYNVTIDPADEDRFMSGITVNLMHDPTSPDQENYIYCHRAHEHCPWHTHGEPS